LGAINALLALLVLPLGNKLSDIPIRMTNAQIMEMLQKYDFNLGCNWSQTDHELTGGSGVTFDKNTQNLPPS
jgi:hypothetical protein